MSAKSAVFYPVLCSWEEIPVGAVPCVVAGMTKKDAENFFPSDPNPAMAAIKLQIREKGFSSSFGIFYASGIVTDIRSDNPFFDKYLVSQKFRAAYNPQTGFGKIKFYQSKLDSAAA